MEGFPFVHTETARFSDLDAMGHVNNEILARTEIEPERRRRRLQPEKIRVGLGEE